jgi:hypothetical protein
MNKIASNMLIDKWAYAYNQSKPYNKIEVDDSLEQHYFVKIYDNNVWILRPFACMLDLGARSLGV